MPEIDAATKRSLSALSEIIAVGRTPVERDYRSPSIVLFDPVLESNTRLPQQLAQLAKGSARLEGRDSVNDVDLAVAHRVACDTLLPVRAATLRAVASGQVATDLGLSRSTAWRAMRDLTELGMVYGEEDAAHVLADTYARLWLAAKISPIP